MVPLYVGYLGPQPLDLLLLGGDLSTQLLLQRQELLLLRQDLVLLRNTQPWRQWDGMKSRYWAEEHRYL